MPDREALVFRGATAVALLHALDDAFVARQPGVGPGQHAIAGAVAAALAIAAAVAFPRLRPGLRAATALAFGALALVNGAMHVGHVALDGPAGADVTGLLAAAAGLVLVALAVAVPLRHPAGAHRWRARAAGTAGVAVLGLWVLVPVGTAIVQTHLTREPVGDPPGAAYRPVTFRAADGLRLAGWYVPSRNGAAVLLVHGGAGDRTGARRHAELLVRHGYGVLLYDARGRGESEGTHNAYGWTWDADVRGALAFLRGRDEVDADRIAGLGLSTGADVLIEVAAEHGGLAAVVADGATGRTMGDLIDADPLTASQFWAVFAAVRVLDGSSPGAPLAELVGDVAPAPLLLVSAGRVPTERAFNERYAKAAGAGAVWWDAPVGHIAGVRERPAEYERRVVGFLDRALLDERRGARSA